MCHIYDKIIVIYITYICQIKHTSFYVDYLDYSAIIFSKNDDYFKAKDGYNTHIVLGVPDIIIMKIEIERLGNFEIK